MLRLSLETAAAPAPADEASVLARLLADSQAVAAQMPDLILISATGGDSALALYDQLSAIAPTLIINYDDKSWQALLTQLGTITGQEQQAAARIAEFDKQLARVKQQMKLPPQPVTSTDAAITPAMIPAKSLFFININPPFIIFTVFVFSGCRAFLFGQNRAQS